MTVSVLGRRFPATLTYVVALGVGILLLLLTVGAALWQNDASRDVNELVRQSIDRRSHYRIVLQRAVDAETAQRGYLLTGDQDYLRPHAGAREEAFAHLDALDNARGLSAADRGELQRLRELITRKFDELDLTISLYGRGRRQEALMILGSDAGRSIMNDARAIVNVALEREGSAIQAALGETDAAARRTQLVILLAAVLLLGVGILVVIAAARGMAEMRASRDEARAAQAAQAAELAARVAAEDKVRHMQKLESIGQITGGVAHDFNNMLAVIMSALQLAKRRIERGEPEAMRFIEAATDGARRAATLTSRLLAFARRTPLSPVVLDANRVLSEMSDLLNRTLGEGIELETVLAAGLWRVQADRPELEQAILNICVNARDAMNGVGKLTIESANAHLDEAYAAKNVDVTAGQYVMIAITDTGGGMSPQVQAQAFEPFFTTKEAGRGTGLGLSHVHGFLKQSSGHVAIYSELGVGTTIKLYLPRTGLAETEVRAAGALNEDALMGDAATIVLVVEDDERVRALSVAALRDLGYTVLHAESGPAALKVLEATPGVSLLFTDVVMPGMTGRVLADEARKRKPDLRVLYTTGYTQNAIVHNGVVDADARLILKPYSLQDLARKVRAALDE